MWPKFGQIRYNLAVYASLLWLSCGIDTAESANMEGKLHKSAPNWCAWGLEKSIPSEKSVTRFFIFSIIQPCLGPLNTKKWDFCQFFWIRLVFLCSRNVRMRSSLVVRASDCQCTSCNGPGFDPSIRRHSGIWGAADEAVLNIVRTKKKRKKSPQKIF